MSIRHRLTRGVISVLVALLIAIGSWIAAPPRAYAHSTLYPTLETTISQLWERAGAQLASAEFPGIPELWTQERGVEGEEVVFEITRLTDPETGLFLNLAACILPVEDPQVTLLTLLKEELELTDSTLLDEGLYDPEDPTQGIHLMSINDLYVAHHRLLVGDKRAVVASAYVPRDTTDAELHHVAHRFLDSVKLGDRR